MPDKGLQRTNPQFRQRVSFLDLGEGYACETHEPCLHDLRLNWRDA